MNRRNPFAILFNLEPDESSIVFTMMLYSAAMGLAINYYFTASSALFLGQFNVDQLPFTILASGIALYATRIVYAWVEKRLPPTHLLTISLIFLAGLITAIRVGLAISHAPWLLFMVMILFRVMIVILVVGFWGLANRLFTLGQSKRLFSIISAGPVLPIMMGSFLLPIITPIIGTDNLFILILAAVLIALGCVLYIHRNFSDVLSLSENIPTTKTKDGKQATPNVFRNRYILLILGLYIVYWIINYSLDYAFLGQLQIYFASNPEQIASFIGTMFGLVQLTDLVVKFFFAGRLISRYGLRFGLFIAPLVLTVGVLLSATSATIIGGVALFFWMVIGTKFVEEVLRDSFNDTSTRILYQPLPIAQRASVLALVEGNGFALTALIAGSILVFFTITGTYTPLGIVVMMLVLCFVWVVLSVMTYREYAQVLRRALERRTFGSTQTLIPEVDIRSILMQKLDSPHADEVIYALNLLEVSDLETVRQQMPRLLHSDLPDVRVYVLERMMAAPFPDCADMVWELAQHDPVVDVRAAALQTFATIRASNAVSVMQPYLTDHDPVVRRAALVGLLRSGGLEGVLIAGQTLYSLLQSAAAQERKIGAQVLGDVAARNFYEPLLLLLHDKDLGVRQAALIAAGQVNHPQLIPSMIAALDHRTLRSTTRQALITIGDPFLEAVRTHFQKQSHRDTLKQLVWVCARMHSPAVIDVLLPYINWTQEEVRTEILRALAKNGCQVSGEARTAVEDCVTAECTQTLELRGLLPVLMGRSETTLMHRSLQSAVREGQERVLYLLSFLFDRPTILNTQMAFHYGTAQQQSYAGEVLDILLPRNLKTTVRPLFASHTIAESSNGGDGLQMRLTAIANDAQHSVWLRTTAAYTLKSLSFDFSPEKELSPMLSIIERVLILKTTTIFSDIPDSVLGELANIVEQIEYPADTMIFAKGDDGKSMYMIVRGKVRVHDGSVTFNTLSNRDVFGEMAVLATEPRAASVTTIEDTSVFRLDQTPFYEAMADYPEISRGIIRVLIGYLHRRMQDVTDLSNRVQLLEGNK